MKAIVSGWYTEIFPTNDEVMSLCKPGQGANTCVWLVCGSKGFECCCLHIPPTLYDRWAEGKTVAKRDGCEKVKEFSPTGKRGTVEF